MKRTASTTIIFGLIVLLIPALAYGQRGGARGGGAAARGGSGVGGMNGSGIGGANGSGVGGVGPSRRTAVIAVAAANGGIGDGSFGERVSNQPVRGGGVAHPGLAGAAIASRRVPIGTVIDVLPAGCAMTFLSEMEYYYCSGQYYQAMGSETEPIYVAAEPYIPHQY